MSFTSAFDASIDDGGVALPKKMNTQPELLSPSSSKRAPASTSSIPSSLKSKSVLAIIPEPAIVNVYGFL